VINEIMAENKTILNPDGSVSDWTELYNTSAQAVSLARYSLTDSTNSPQKWVFPSNSSIAARGYLVVLLDSSRPPSTAAGLGLNAGFSIKGTGDQLSLYSPATNLVDTVRFGPQAVDNTIGRGPDGTGAFVLTTPTPGGANIAGQLGSPFALRINEWMASPSSGKDWFELYNPGTNVVGLSDLYFADSKSTSPIASLSFIGTGLDGFLRFDASNSTSDNETNFKLSGSGDAIALYRAGVLIDSVVFGQQVTDVSQGRLPDGSANIVSLNRATPGKSNLILYDGLVVNEVLSHTDPPLEDAVEFYNQTAAPVDISGWFLSNSRSELKKYKLPPGSIVLASGYLVVYQDQFCPDCPNPTSPNSFTFNSAHGDQVYLSEATANGNLTGAIVTEVFEAAEHGVSFGRYNTSVPDDYKFVAMDHLTFGVDNPTTVEQFRTGKGAPNSAPKVGPVVINELMYNPPLANPTDTDNTLDEYIELLNITPLPVPLYDPAYRTNIWRLQNAIDFTFPPLSSIPAFRAALVVSFDPAVNTTQAAAFRAKYSVPDNVQIFGPYTGKLKNTGDAVELYRPDTPQDAPHPDAGFVPYFRVDKVNYTYSAPWPPNADATGNSLQRKNATAFGNDPVNWEVAAPTAGKANPSETVNSPLTILGIRSDPGGPIIQFTSEVRHTYTVHYQNSLTSAGPWSDLLTTNALGNSVTVQDASATGAQRYYRISTPAGQ
jgi:hypothetical protein